MNQSNKLLSDLVGFRTYAKYIPHLNRREVNEETVNRSMTMHLQKFPKLSKDIMKAFDLVHDHKILPSMRGFQFAGDAVLKNNARQYNCSFRNINDVRAFGEILYLLLSGTGVGYSVQKRHVNELPPVQLPRQEGLFCVQDSIYGWAQAVDVLMEAYLYGRIRPQFDFFQISPKGTRLVTTGSKAPGPEPLKHMLQEVEKRLKVALGRKLRPIEVHDMICLISDCVLAGGIRRSALIALFDRNDKEMLTAKSGEWWIQHPYRARANNSAILPRGEVTYEEFHSIYAITKDSNAGEPGFSWTNDVDMGFNPCHEVSLNNKQFCNLSTINQTGLTDKKDFLNRVHYATLIGTLQAAYTDFPYLTPEWKSQTEAEALIGVSFTGVADSGGVVTDEWLEEGARLVLEVNERVARKIGINPAARAGVMKPEGSSSAFLGSASGIHGRWAKPYYLRRMQISSNDALAQYLVATIPDLMEVAYNTPNTMVVTIPQESPEGSIAREDETALDLLKRAMMYNKYWIGGTHRSGANRNNVSCTVSVKPEEWDTVEKYLWQNRDLYSGISLLPYDGGTYRQAPFEACSKEIYDAYLSKVKDIDLREVREEEAVDHTQNVACGGGQCEVL